MSSEQQERWRIQAADPLGDYPYRIVAEDGNQEVAGVWSQPQAEHIITIHNARLTDVQQDAGGRWEEYDAPWRIAGWAGEHDEGGAHIVDAKGKTIASTYGGMRDASTAAEWRRYRAIAELIASAPLLESRLSEEQQARQRAERALQDLTPGGSDFQELEACIRWITNELQTLPRLTVEAYKAKNDAEAENTRLREQVEGLAAKAALADELCSDGKGERWSDSDQHGEYCRWCTGFVAAGTKYPANVMRHDQHCPKARYDALTATQDQA